MNELIPDFTFIRNSDLSSSIIKTSNQKYNLLSISKNQTKKLNNTKNKSTIIQNIKNTESKIKLNLNSNFIEKHIRNKIEHNVGKDDYSLIMR